jgi:hypothetical protein
MDFLRRNANDQPQATRPTAGNQATSSASVAKENTKSSILKHEPRWLRIVSVVLLFSISILTLAIALLLYNGKSKESHLVDGTKNQAVFLTNGQVYFGRIAGINDQVVDLQAIYYLNSQQQPDASTKSAQTNQTSFSLVKLGCELHGPSDQMVINREQVSFWENLKADGKVAKAIEQFKSQNPNGQTCTDNSAANSTTQSTTPAANTAKKP